MRALGTFFEMLSVICAYSTGAMMLLECIVSGLMITRVMEWNWWWILLPPIVPMGGMLVFMLLGQLFAGNRSEGDKSRSGGRTSPNEPTR